MQDQGTAIDDHRQEEGAYQCNREGRWVSRRMMERIRNIARDGRFLYLDKAAHKRKQAALPEWSGAKPNRWAACRRRRPFYQDILYCLVWFFFFFFSRILGRRNKMNKLNTLTKVFFFPPCAQSVVQFHPFGDSKSIGFFFFFPLQ